MGEKLHRRVKQNPRNKGQTLTVRNRLDKIEYTYDELNRRQHLRREKGKSRLRLTEVTKE